MSFKVGDRVNVYGRPWGKFRAPPKWRYGKIVGENLLGQGRSGRFPVAVLGGMWGESHRQEDYSGQAFLVAFTEGGGALWYHPSDLKPVKLRTKSNPSRIIRPGDPDYPKRTKPYRFRLGTLVKGADGPAKVVSMGRGRGGVTVTVEDRHGRKSTWREDSLERYKPARKWKNPMGDTYVVTHANPKESDLDRRYRRAVEFLEMGPGDGEGAGEFDPNWRDTWGLRGKSKRQVIDFVNREWRLHLNPRVRKNHWLLPMAVGAGATLAVQRLAKKRNPFRAAAGKYRVVKFATLSDPHGKVLKGFDTLAEAQAYHKRLVLKGGKLRHDYAMYAIIGD